VRFAATETFKKRSDLAMAQKLVHSDSASLKAEQFGTILHSGVMKSTLFHRFAPLRPCGAKRIMRNFLGKKDAVIPSTSR